MVEKLTHSRQLGLPKLMDFAKAEILLKDAKRILDRHGIRFFLFFGTLIGALRENDFIWYDHDMDIGILWEDIKDLDKTNKDFQDLGYSVNFGEGINGVNIFRNITRLPQREKFEMYAIIPYKGYRVWAKRAHVYDQQTKKKNLKFVLLPLPQKHFEKFDTIEFKGEQFLVPHNPKELLTYQYADWRTPNTAQASQGVQSIIVDVPEFEKALL